MKDALHNINDEEARIEQEAKKRRGKFHDYLYTQFVDEAHPLNVAIKNTLKTVGQDISNLDFVDNPKKWMQAMKGWSGKANFYLKFQVRSWDGKQKLSDGLEQIIKKHNLADTMDEFNVFYMAARMRSLHEVSGDDLFGKDTTSEAYHRRS